MKDTAASTQHRGRAYIWHPRHRIHALLNTVVISVRCIGSAAGAILCFRATSSGGEASEKGLRPGATASTTT